MRHTVREDPRLDERPVEETPPGLSPSAGAGRRRRSPWIWILITAGLLLVLAATALGSFALGAFVASKGYESDLANQPPPFTVNPVNVQKPWFSVSNANTGTLEGTASGTTGSGTEGADWLGYFEVVAPGSQDGVLVSYRVPVLLRSNTKVTINGRQVKPSDVADAATGGTLEGSKVVVQFERVRNRIVATSVRASAPNPDFTDPIDIHY
jgi:hypothetical protein